MTWVVVPAAGRGMRAGGTLPKQYQPILGRPLLAHTLDALTRHPAISGLVLVIPANDPHWPGWTHWNDRPLIVTEGGAERADSVLAGLLTLPESVAAEEAVLVHDAARPCLQANDISALLAADNPHGALLAVPLVDTLKRVDSANAVAETVPREQLWRAMTPQLFRRGVLTSALQQAVAAGQIITDEAMAMERAGFSPRLVEGAADNLKVTTAADFALAEFLLRRRQST